MPSSRFPILRGPDAQQSRVQDNIQASVGPAVERLQNTPIMGAPPPAWIYPSPLNDFITPSTTGFTRIAFHKDALGYVHVKMSVTHVAGIAALSNIFQLPMGYRPKETLPFAGMGSLGAYQGVFVLATGYVQNRLIMAPNNVLYANFSFLAEA